MAQHMEPGIAYLSGLLWLPKELVDLRLMRASLTFTPTSKSKLKKTEPIYAWAEGVHHIGVPRYLWGPIGGPVFRQRFLDFGVQLIDLRPQEFETLDVVSHVELDAIRRNGIQAQAVGALLQHDAGGIVLSCGLGKSAVTLHAAAQFRAPFIIVVDSEGLQQQWLGEIRKFLTDSRGREVPVGLVGGGYKQWDRPIVIAMVQTLYKLARDGKMPEGLRERFAVAIFDEAQIMGAKEFVKSAPLFYGRRWWGSATPVRQDGLERMYFLHLGPPLFTYLQQDLKPSFYIYRVQHKVDVVDPQFRAHVMLYGQMNTPLLYSYLAGLMPRTYEIASLVRQGMDQGRKILVITRSLFLLQQLKALLPDAGVIHGGVKGERRLETTAKSEVLLAQFKLAEKALNKPELDMVVICEPFHWVGSFQQIIGRAQRMVEGKNLPIVVVIEDEVGPCLRACKSIRRMVSTWPREMGGPYSWTMLQSRGTGAV